MPAISLNNLMHVGQPAPLPHPQGQFRLSMLSFLALSAAGCTFDVTPVASMQRAERSDAVSWSPRASDGDVVAMRPADGELDASPKPAVAARDAGRPDASGSRPSSGGAGSSAQTKTDAAVSSNTDASAPSAVATVDAGANTACRAGSYQGTFDGSVTYLEGALSGIQGTIRAEMTLDAAGDYLRVRDGHVTGANDQGAEMKAGWTGSLNCKTGQLEDAMLVDGAWDNGSTFSGTLSGEYSTSAASLSGTWRVRSNEWLWAGGDGHWNMARSAAP